MAWDDWIGREQLQRDVLTPALLARFRATLDSDATGDIAPQGIHWCLCTPDTATAGLDVDGHPKRGGFLPPVPLPDGCGRRARSPFMRRFASARLSNAARSSRVSRKRQAVRGRLSSSRSIMTRQATAHWRSASGRRSCTAKRAPPPRHPAAAARRCSRAMRGIAS